MLGPSRAVGQTGQPFGGEARQPLVAGFATDAVVAAQLVELGQPA